MERHLPADEAVWWFIKPGTLCYEVLASVDEEIGSWRQMTDEFGAVVYNKLKR